MMIQNFEIGDKVRIDGEDGIHTIQTIRASKTPLGWHAIVQMTDGKIGLVDSSGYTDLEKL